MQAASKLLLGAAIAVAGALSSPVASARTVIYANIAPPALRVETVPAPRPGYVWIAGYWGWGHDHYVWHSGHWVHARHGYRYAPSHWEREGHRWRYHEGRWDR
jgi:WXXGXW repeat (2 copies)